MLNQFAIPRNDFNDVAMRILKIENTMRMFFEEDNAISLYMADPAQAEIKESILFFLNTFKFYLSTKNRIVNGIPQKSQFEKFMDALKAIKDSYGTSMRNYLEQQNPALGAFLQLNIKHFEKIDTALAHYFRECLEFDEVATRILKIEKLVRLSFEKENELSYFMSDPANVRWKLYLEAFSEEVMKHLSKHDEVIDGYVEKNQFESFMDAFSRIKENKGFSMSMYLKINNPGLGAFFSQNLEGLESADKAYKAYYKNLSMGKSDTLKKG